MQHVDHLLSAYIDNELEEQERVVVEKHLQDCTDCLELYEDFSRMSASFTHAFETISLPEQAIEQLMTRINQLDTPDSPDPISVLSYAALRWGTISSILLLLAVNVSLMITFGPFFSFIQIFYRLAHGVVTIFSAIPYLGVVVTVTCFLLIGMSLWLLHQLLRLKKVEITQ
ncbi:anti-sigma factor family protein [Shimazuella kribbensis]|uniref:anti-sigma factor family protein n=1 Tax=Shimazuella kribbensis TaxID=139808 RepID=UPI000404C9B2|nr:zf-HC2 domain-containing protein [Shimazuella kribbensis]